MPKENTEEEKKLIADKEECWQGNSEYHRCSFGHCNYCGKCPAGE